MITKCSTTQKLDFLRDRQKLISGFIETTVNGWGVSPWSGLLLYLLKAQMLEDLFDYILMFYEGNNPHGPLALWPDLSKGSGYIVAT